MRIPKSRELGLGNGWFTMPLVFDALHTDEIAKIFEQGG